MAKQLIIGLHAEGVTDKRFLESVIKRTFEEVAFECTGDIEILDIQIIEVAKKSFIEDACNAARDSYEKYGVMVLCIHTDTDKPSDKVAFQNRILPAFKAIQKLEEEACKNLVAVVPIQMIESWMLADKDLLKEELGTNKSDKQLGIEKKPESLTDPKKAISEAIKIAFEDKPRRRKRPEIGEFYRPLGQKIKLEALEKIPSYCKFKKEVRQAFKTLNYLH